MLSKNTKDDKTINEYTNITAPSSVIAPNTSIVASVSAAQIT